MSTFTKIWWPKKILTKNRGFKSKRSFPTTIFTRVLEAFYMFTIKEFPNLSKTLDDILGLFFLFCKNNKCISNIVTWKVS